MNRGFLFDVDAEVAVDPAQSPWEFSGYSATVLDEHAQRRTTSIDHKISQLRLRRVKGKGLGNGVIKLPEGDEITSDSEVDEGGLEDDIREQETGQWGEESDVSDPDLDGESGGLDLESEGSEEAEEEEDVEEEEEEEEGEDEDEEMDPRAGSHSRVGRIGGEDQDVLERVKKGKEAGRNGTTEKKEELGRSGKARKKDGKMMPKVYVEDALASADGDNVKKEKVGFFASSEGATFSAKSFAELNISRPLVRACEALGYERPTPIQAACIPLALTGRDICGSAVTGSGKTGAFVLPVLERLLFRPRRVPATRVLILTPTRELAVQVHSMLQKFAQFTDICCCLVVGGLSSKVQETSLRARPDIVVATPGRMIDHLHNAHSVGLEELAILVLDEADRLLELGFSQEVQELVRLCPKRRQTMLFSATMTEEVAALIQLSLNSPVRLSADPSTQRPATLSEEVVKIRPALEGDKEAVLLALCTRSFMSKVIVFSGTKVEAHRLKILFGLSGLKAGELHGNLTQAMRLDALESFRKQEVDFLIATDVAARGLDIVGVETVINFHCPRDITMYVHRVGRTARAGRQGCAVTLVTEQERSLLKAIAKRAGSKLQNRQVATAAIAKWQSKIEEMEDDVRAVQYEEREERALRKAEMEANKAQNMVEHEAEIYSRPKREWFQSIRDKRMGATVAKAAKDGSRKGEESNKVVSAEEAEELKRREKRKKELEKNMTRKKRRRLEAEREDAEAERRGVSEAAEEMKDIQAPEKKTKKSVDNTSRQSVVELAYRRAKAAKSTERLVKAGKIAPQKKRKSKVDSSQKPRPGASQNRKEEMEELFQDDVRGGKQQKPWGSTGAPRTPGRKPGVSKRAFKSKSRYKRRK